MEKIALNQISKALCGTLLLYPETYYSLEARIKEKIFPEGFREVIAEIKDQYSKGDTIDIALLSMKFNDSSMESVSDIMNSALPDKAEEHIFILEEEYQKEIFAQLSHEINDAIHSNKPSDFIRTIVAEKLDSLDEEVESSFKHVSELKIDVVESIGKAMDSHDTGELTGVDTGFPTLNNITGGWQKPDLIIVAGRPGMGKTTFAMQVAKNNAERNNPIAVFSLEMEDQQIMKLLIASETNIPVEYMRTGNISDQEYHEIQKATDTVGRLPIYIDDTARSLNQLKQRARMLVRKKGVKAIYIDYLQLINIISEKLSTNDRVSKISRELKSLAMELKVPIICLSQLSRSVETRGGDKRPMLSDLRDSGAIEQDADMVVFAYRPSYYGLESDFDSTDKTEIIISKYRHGRLGTIECIFENGEVLEYEGFNMGQIDSTDSMFSSPIQDKPNIDPFDNSDIASNRPDLDDDTPF